MIDSENISSLSLIAAKIASEAAVAAAVEVASQSASRQENIMGELKLLRLEFETLSSAVSRVETGMDTFKVGIGIRVQEAEKFLGTPKNSLAVLENSIGTMARILWLIGGATITALVAGILKLIIK